MKKLLLWMYNIFKKKSFDSIETFSNFIFENRIEVDNSIIISISNNLITSK